MSDEFKPTWLYVKRCNHCGLLYVGKTIKADPFRYYGSGKRWLKHVRRHGRQHVETLTTKLYADRERCTRAAIAFSEKHDILNARNANGERKWANLIFEDGLSGTVGYVHNKSRLRRMRDSMLGRRMFNDGVRHYMVYPEDPRIKELKLKSGRTEATKANMSHPKSKKPVLSKAERKRRADRMRYAGTFSPNNRGGA